MATWEDGPEYAPLERPDLFEEPAVEPLPIATTAPNLAAGAPLEPPDAFLPPSSPVAPLKALVPTTMKVSRDPMTAFDVATATVTATETAWSAAHSSGSWAAPATVGTAPTTITTAPTRPGFDPTAPITLADRTELWETSSTGRPSSSILLPAPRIAPVSPWGAPAYPAPAGAPAGYSNVPPGYGVPGTTSWFGPGVTTYRKGKPITVSEILKAMSPALAIVLGLACIIPPLSPVLYLVAFALATFIRYRGNFIRTVFGISTLIQVFMAFIGLTLDAASTESWWNNVGWTSCFFSLLTLITVVFTMALALRSGERPSRKS